MAYGLQADILIPTWHVDDSITQPPTPGAAPSTSCDATMRLIGRVLAGEVDAFNELIRTVETPAYSVAYRILHDEESAADALQESLLKAYRALPTFRGGRFKHWFLRIVTNTCYDLLREWRSKRTASLDALPLAAESAAPFVDPAERPEAYAERMEAQAWIERGLRAMPVDQRMVVVLCDVQGHKYEEAAEILGIPVGTVKSRLSRGRVWLRDFLHAQGIGPR